MCLFTICRFESPFVIDNAIYKTTTYRSDKRSPNIIHAKYFGQNNGNGKIGKTCRLRGKLCPDEHENSPFFVDCLIRFF